MCGLCVCVSCCNEIITYAWLLLLLLLVSLCADALAAHISMVDASAICAFVLWEALGPQRVIDCEFGLDQTWAASDFGQVWPGIGKFGTWVCQTWADID